MGRDRDSDLDFIRAVAIILVVVGHVIQTIISPDSFDSNIVFRYIYCFHMKLFIFISGYLACSSKRENNAVWLKRRARKLVVPFCVWFLIMYFVKAEISVSSFTDRVRRVICSPDDGGSWFLWVLFLLCCCLFCVVEIYNVSGKFVLKNSELCRMGLSIAAETAIVFIIWFLSGMGSVLGIRLCVEYILFFMVGFFVRFAENHVDEIKTKLTKIEYLCLILFPAAAFFWHRTKFFIYADELYRKGEVYGISINMIKIILIAYAYLLVPFLGIGFNFAIARILPQTAKVLIGKIGIYSMEIYILHGFFRKRYTGNIMLDSLLSVILGVFLSMLIGILIEKSRILGSLLFGREREKQ